MAFQWLMVALIGLMAQTSAFANSDGDVIGPVSKVIYDAVCNSPGGDCPAIGLSGTCRYDRFSKTLQSCDSDRGEIASPVREKLSEELLARFPLEPEQGAGALQIKFNIVCAFEGNDCAFSQP